MWKGRAPLPTGVGSGEGALPTGVGSGEGAQALPELFLLRNCCILVHSDTLLNETQVLREIGLHVRQQSMICCLRLCSFFSSIFVFFCLTVTGASP